MACALILTLYETLTHLTSNAQDGACLDVRGEGFWGDKHQSAFLMLGFSILLHQAIVVSP